MHIIYKYFSAALRRINLSRYSLDIVWQASGNILAQAIALLSMPILSRIYSPEHFGILSIFSQAVFAFSIVLTARFEYLLMVPADKHEAIWIVRAVVSIGGIQAFFWTILFLIFSDSEPARKLGGISEWLWLLPITAWILSCSVALQHAIQRYGTFKVSGSSEVIGRCAYVLSALTGSLALPNPIGLMLSTLLNGVAKLGWLLRERTQLGVIHLHPRRLESIPRGLLALSLSTSFSNLMVALTGLAPLLFIGKYFGADEVGQYGLVISTLFLPSAIIGQAIGHAYYKQASQNWHAGTGLTPLLLVTSKNILRISIPLYIGLSIISPFLYQLIFGASWRQAGEIASILCLAAGCGLLSTPVDRTSLVLKVWWYLSTWQLLRAIATLAIIYWSISKGWAFERFVVAISINLAIFYCADWICSLVFTKKYSNPIPVQR
jgi:teichuronic acid exporter